MRPIRFLQRLQRIVPLSSATRPPKASPRLGDWGWLCLLALAFAVASTGCVTTKNLQVSRFTTSNLTDADADRIFADGTTVLQTNDGPGDVECKIRFLRDGAVTVFATGDGSIDSQAEFNAVIGLPGYVKVVNQINWCGALIPNVIGCAPVPGNSLTVVRFTQNREGILWAHEYGHTKGLNHRADVNAVMNATIGLTRRRVNSAECTAFRN